MRKRAAGAAAVIALLAGVPVLPAAVAAQIRPTAMWLYMGQSCVGGASSSWSNVHVVWRRASGRVLADVTYRTRRSGYWEVCSDGA
jgi:hypothetical protein